MPGALQSVWTLSIALAALSLVSMAVLIGARLMRQHRDKGLLQRRKHLSGELIRYALLGGSPPAIPVRTRHERSIALQIALDARSILDDEARERVSDVLRGVSLDASVRRTARHGRVPDRIAALEALQLFPGEATHTALEYAQASRVFRVCLAALRTRVELGDLPDLAAVLKLTERPEGGRALSLFKIVEACVRADIPGALNLLVPITNSDRTDLETPAETQRDSQLSPKGETPPPCGEGLGWGAAQQWDWRSFSLWRIRRLFTGIRLAAPPPTPAPPHKGEGFSLRRNIVGGRESALQLNPTKTSSGLPPKARIMLLKALGATGSWAAFRDIGQASLDPDPEVRAAALTALRAMAAPAAVPIFTAALGDPDWQVRLKAVEGIGQLGKPEDRPSIAPLLNDPVWWIRFRADEALRRLDGRGPELQLPQDPPKLRKRRKQLAHAS